MREKPCFPWIPIFIACLVITLSLLHPDCFYIYCFYSLGCFSSWILGNMKGKNEPTHSNGDGGLTFNPRTIPGESTLPAKVRHVPHSSHPSHTLIFPILSIQISYKGNSKTQLFLPQAPSHWVFRSHDKYVCCCLIKSSNMSIPFWFKNMVEWNLLDQFVIVTIFFYSHKICLLSSVLFNL